MRHRRWGSWAQLLLACALIAIVWLQLLPRLAQQPSMAGYLQQLDEHRVDPSAMFYTELESMEPILERLERR